MQTTLGEMHGFRIGILTHLESLYTIKKCTRGILVIGALIGQWTCPAGSIPLFT